MAVNLLFQKHNNMITWFSVMKSLSNLLCVKLYTNVTYSFDAEF